MHATVHIDPVGIRRVVDARRALPPATTRGLRYLAAAVPAPLGTAGPRPMVGRVVAVAFWDDAAAADAAFAGTRWGPEAFTGVRIDAEPVRAIGRWTGLPVALPTAPEPVHDGPSFVLTIARLKLLQAPRFFAASAKAERHVLASTGLTWGLGLAAPERRTLMTISWWHDVDAMAATVRAPGGHADAMAKQAAKDFHHESAFIRMRPTAVRGSIAGRHPIPEVRI